MARGGLEPPTRRFSVVGQPALTRSAECSKNSLLAGCLRGGRRHVIKSAFGRDTVGFRWVCVAGMGLTA
jgi:hypothetical protein